ncbi:cytochrome c biogenesis protein CcdA [Saccharomonospora amisosensis]|uniref:Cytochrome c biogenesis protein CcdA n=1 Tax=Saccharomonospora amisosensis TaxID=1128677 RepID=A0A7X5ZQR1_9PSEU|nr:GAP family protein [Saccharomonospora amisosensis]NIJ12114.1 cytochrome c biogenesis protein CcdA [Saccharomonospora amisosensis]
MNEAIGQILPLAVAVTISPVLVIAGILLLFTERPVSNGAAYLLGTVLGIGGVLAALTVVAATQNLSAGTGASVGAAWLRIVVGVLLLGGSLRRFRARPGPQEEARMPSWMGGITSFHPGKSLVTGLVLGAANPKNLAMAFSAAVAVAGAGLTVGQSVAGVAVFTVIAVLGVATPLAMVLTMGERARPRLDTWKNWLRQHNSVVMSVLFLVFGVVLIGEGVRQL